jgi:lambda family phage tail tape measure protein
MGLQGVARDLEIDRQRLGRDLTVEETAALREKNKALEEGTQSARLQQVAQDALSDSIYDFVTGAKSAKDAAKSFFDSIAQYITRMIAENWSKKIGDMFSGSSANGGEGGGTNWFSQIIGLFGGGSANGNAFMGGQVQAFATGGVVDRTTAFGMAGGRFGIMGEAGPEAILPLHRGPDGKLGVRMAANDDSHSRSIGPAVVNQTLVLQGRPDSRTPAQYEQAAARAQNRVTSRNR